MKIPLFKIFWDQKDVESIAKIIRRGSNWAAGQEIVEFEQKAAQYLKRKYCVAFNSGTSALQSVLLAYNIGKGNEVIVPSFTFIATANAVTACGAKAKFADIEEKTLGLDPRLIEKNINKKTKAIIPVHYGGRPCQIEKIRKIARKYQILLIEDAAEAFGSKYKNKMIGSFGDSAMFSFCQNKIITCGEGGAIVTDDINLRNKLVLIRSHGRKESKNYFQDNLPNDYISLGYNYRMSSISASLALSQLKKAEKNISRRIKKANYYIEKLNKIQQIQIIDEDKNSRNVFQLFSIQADDRNKLIEYLASRGITSKVYFDPIHKSYFYWKKLNYKVKLPITEVISSRIVSLPFYANITYKEINYIVDTIKEFYQNDD